MPAWEELHKLESNSRRWRDGYHEPPPVPHTRDAAGRAQRLGAPLWALCDFVPSVPESDRADIEAALESSGLLDAWITPDGRLLGQDEQDTILAAGISEAAPKERSVRTVL